MKAPVPIHFRFLQQGKPRPPQDSFQKLGDTILIVLIVVGVIALIAGGVVIFIWKRRNR